MSANARGLSDIFSSASASPAWKLAAATGLLLAAAMLASLPAIFPASPLSRHMATHILLMDAVAPLTALFLFPALSPHLPSGSLRSSVAIATTLQMVVLWAAHAPVLMNSAMHSRAGAAAIQGILLLAALWFWTTVMAQRGAGRWRSILALLVTGKLFCLLGAILTFAPRLLYHGHGMAGAADVSALQDQQLAGLLMVVACPLVYVLTGVVMSARWLLGLSGQAGTGRDGR